MNVFDFFILVNFLQQGSCFIIKLIDIFEGFGGLGCKGVDGIVNFWFIEKVRNMYYGLNQGINI